MKSTGNKSEIELLRQQTEELIIANKLLKESEERFRKLFEDHSAVKLLIDPDNGNIVDANKAASDFYGWTQEELKRMNINQINTLSSEEIQIEMGKARNSNQKYFEFCHRLKNGSVKYVQVFSGKVELNGKDYLHSIVHDITNAKLAEDAIKEGDEIYRAFINSNSDMIFLKDDQLKHIVANTSLADFYGKTPAEIIGKTDFDLTSKEAAIICQQSDLRVLNDNSIIVTEEAVGDRFFETTKFPVALKNNKIGIGGIIKDTTEHKRAEQEISMLAHSLRSINDCVSITDLEDKVLFVNESFLKTYGYNENELNGKLLSEVLSPNNPQEIVDEIIPTTIRKPWMGELLNKRKDGTEFPIYLSTSLIKDKEGKPLGLIGVSKDITEHNHVRQELVKAKEKAEAANKLKDAFMANISHEIRTPLNGLLGIASLIKDEYQSIIKKEDEILFEGIDISSHRIIRTVDMILNYSRLRVGEFPSLQKKLELSSVCKKLVIEFTSAAKMKSLVLTFINKCEKSEIFVDEYSITMAISNLIDNAIKFTNKGFVNVILHKEKNDDLILDIKDTGIGISQEYLDHIFEPYLQEEMGYGRAYEGIGLGLAIVREIIRMNKYSINVESKKGEGTIFSINLGKGVNEIKVETGKIAVIPSVAKKTGRTMVLIVEDDAINQFTMRLFLKDRYNIMVADSAENAREILKKEKIDIILMDISIKGNMNGMKLTKELKTSKEFSHIPIIAVTAHAFISDRRNSIAAGCDSYLAKPFTKDALLKMIANFIIKKSK